MTQKFNLSGSTTAQEHDITTKIDMVRLKNPTLANQIEKDLFSDDEERVLKAQYNLELWHKDNGGENATI